MHSGSKIFRKVLVDIGQCNGVRAEKYLYRQIVGCYTIDQAAATDPYYWPRSADV